MIVVSQFQTSWYLPTSLKTKIEISQTDCGYVSSTLEREGKIVLLLTGLLGGSVKRYTRGIINLGVMLTVAGAVWRLIQSLRTNSGLDSLFSGTLTILSDLYLF